MEGLGSAPSDGETVATVGRGGAADGELDVGILIAQTPLGDVDQLQTFAARMAGDAADELGNATDVVWRFHAEEPAPPTPTIVVRPNSTTRPPTRWPKDRTTSSLS